MRRSNLFISSIVLVLALSQLHFIKGSTSPSNHPATKATNSISPSSLSSISSSCEPLETNISYKQENAPKDISPVLRVMVEQLNGVLDVQVDWNGIDIRRVLGDHYVTARVTRLVSSVEDASLDPDRIVLDEEGRKIIKQCFSVQFNIEDSNECTLPYGNDMRHQCVSPAVCVNTIGSYECVCPMISSTNMNDITDPLHQHDPASTPSDEFWSQLAGTESIRNKWDLSLPLSNSNCPSLSSTHQCCLPNAHTSRGQVCHSSFRCPTDPCSSTQQQQQQQQQQQDRETSKKAQSSSPCASTATCVRHSDPLTQPTHTCQCPNGTIGNGKKCRKHIDPKPQPKVTYDGVTPTSDTLENIANFCGCTKPIIDPCAGYPPCKRTNEICVADHNNGNKPTCQCKPGYVLDEDYGCVDLTPPKLQLRCDPQNKGLNILYRGDVYQECAVDILDEHPEEYSRSLKIAYSRPISPGKCLVDLGKFTVNYTVATPWTNPPFAGALRTVEIRDRNVCDIPISDYKNWCNEILPKCDIENGAACTPKRGGWTCKCPDGTIGDGILISEGGNGCIDNKKPIIYILGSNPRVFKVSGSIGLTAYLDRDKTDSDKIETLKQKLQQYESDLESITESSNGAELCGSPTKTHDSCVSALDQTYHGVVNLTHRVKIGKPIYISTPKESNSNIYIWKIPYDVTDDAGNKATTIYRIVKVVEMSFAELENSVRQDIMKTKKKEIDDAVELALIKDRRERTIEDKRKTKCPPCPKCEECTVYDHSSSTSREACQSICDEIGKASPSETCTSQTDSSADFTFMGMVQSFVHDTISNMATQGQQNQWDPIFYFIVVFVVITILIWIIPSGNYYAKSDIEQEQALRNAVTYHRSPPPKNTMEYSSIDRNEGRLPNSSISRGNSELPPPRVSLSFSAPKRQESSPPNFFSPQNMNKTAPDEDIYQNMSPITPSRSYGTSIGNHASAM